MALTTAKNYIDQAFRKIGQMRPGYSVSPELYADAINEWQLLFDGYNAQRTMNYTEPDYVFPVTGPGHGTTGNGQTFGGTGYTFGPTAVDFAISVPRPPAIVRMNLYYTASNAGQPTRLPLSQISMEEWMNIPVIQIQPAINVATTFAYDAQWPNGVIWIWPPLNGNSLEIFTWGNLSVPSVTTDLVSIPQGYGDLVVFQLASRLYSMATKQMYEHQNSIQWIRGQAEIARQRVAAVNAPMPRMRNDFISGSRANTGGDNSWSLLLAGVPY